MHRAAVFLQLALWASGIHALGPNIPKYDVAEVDVTEKRQDAVNVPGFVTFKMVQAGPSQRDETTTNKVSRIARGLANKYGSKHPSRTQPDDGPTLVGRKNTYTVVTPTPVTQSNSAGIYQDGTDYSYFIQAQLGSGATPMYMLIDTGASTTWVMGSGCTSASCTSHNTFGSASSTTFKDTGTSFSVGYGSGDVSGNLIQDSMKVAGLSVSFPFGLANQTSSQFTQFPFDGILGLSMGAAPNFLDSLKQAKAVNANIFAVTLSRSSDGTNGGEISFGATDPAKYTGDISYTALGNSGSWAIPMDEITVSGKSIGVASKQAYIDTGTTFAFGPPADVAALYKAIPDSKSTDGGVTWTVPCDPTISVAFSFSGKSYALSAKDFVSAPNNGVCTGNIYGMEVVSGAWLLGDVFLKNVYAVFDLDQTRIGFASKVSVAQATSTTAVSPMVVSTMTLTGGATSVTTMTPSPTTQTNLPSMGFTGGHETSASAASPTAAAVTTSANSPTPSSQGDRSGIGTIYVSIACIISTIAMIA